MLFSIHNSVIAQTRTNYDSLETALNRIKNTSDIDTNAVSQMANLAHYYVSRDTGKSVKYANKAIQWSQIIHYPRGLGHSYRIMGIIQRHLGNYQNSLLNYDKALNIFKDINDTRGIGWLYLDRGILYRSLDNESKALDDELKALDRFSELGDSLHIISAYINIGTLYNEEGKYHKAITNFTKSLKYLNTHHKQNYLSIIYENLGVSYQYLKQYKEALSYYQKSVTIQNKLGNEHIISYNYQNMGDIYHQLKNYRKALSYLFKANRINQHLGDKGIISNTFTTIGFVYLDEHKLKTALMYANKSIKLAQESGLLSYLEAAEKLKSEIYADLQEYKRAYNYEKKYYALEDSLEKQKESKKFSEFAILYESKQKEQKIKLLQKEDALQKAHLKKEALFQKSLIIISVLLIFIIILLANRYRGKKNSEKVLREKNNELEKANALVIENEQTMQKQAEQLQDKNEELLAVNHSLQLMDENKNDFFRIAAHDLKNPLVGISSLAELMSSEDFEKNPEAAYNIKDQLLMIQKASHDMINLISTLLTVNQLDSNSFQVAPMSQPINDIIINLIDKYENIANNKNISINFVSNSDNPYATIDNEAFRQVMDNLISNALKYSPKQSTVKVKASSEGDKTFIRVEDNGPGLTKEEQNKLFEKFSKLSPKPTSNESSTGLGLYIVKKFVVAMNGQVWCESEPGKGSAFVVELPNRANHKFSESELN